MTPEHPFSDVFKKTTNPPPSQIDPKWRLVAYDPIKRKVIKKSFWSFINDDDIVNFLIKDSSSFADGAQHRGFQINLEDFAKNCTLSVIVRYKAYCLPNQEEQFIKKLDNYNEPGPSLDRLIKQWISRVLEDEPTYLNEFYQNQQELQIQVEHIAKAEGGIAIKIFISPEKEDQILSTTTLNIDANSVQIQNFPEPQRFHLNLTLNLIPNKRILAMIDNHKLPKLADYVEKELNHFVLTEYHKPFYFFDDYDKGDLRHKIERHLTELLEKRGWQLAKIDLSCNEKRPVLKFDDTLNAKVQVNHMFPRPVEIHNQAHAHLRSYALYKTAGSPDLHEWFKTMIEQTVRSVLIDKEYDEILAEFRQIKPTIIEKMAEAAKAIGYQLQPLISKTDLGPEKLLEGFVLEHKQLEFQTNALNAPASLGFLIHGKLRNLSKVRHILKAELEEPHTIQGSMTNLVVEKIKSFIIGVDPERFYMEFETPGKKHTQSVKMEVQEIITKVLEDKFEAYEVDAKIYPGNSHITEKLRQLLTTQKPFEAQIIPFQGDYPIPIEGEYRVTSVYEHGWQDFLQREFDMLEVGNQLRRFVEAKFSQISEEQILDGLRQLHRFQTELDQLAGSHFQKLFGINVEIFNVKKQPSKNDAMESDWQTYKREALYADKKSNLEMLRSILANKRMSYENSFTEKMQADAEHRKAYHGKFIEQIRDEEKIKPEELREKIFGKDLDLLNPSQNELQEQLDADDKRMENQIRKIQWEDLYTTTEREAFPWAELGMAATSQEPTERRGSLPQDSSNRQLEDKSRTTNDEIFPDDDSTPR